MKLLTSLPLHFCAAVKEAAVQRRHNLYRDSMVLTNSDPNLHLLGDDTIDWAGQFGGVKDDRQGGEAGNRRRKQIVSMIRLEGMPPLPYESCLEVPGVDNIPEENEGHGVAAEKPESPKPEPEEHGTLKTNPGSPDSIDQIRHLINPVEEVVVPTSEEDGSQLTNGVLPLEQGDDVKHITTVTETMPRQSPTKGLSVTDETSDLSVTGQSSDTDLLEDQQTISAIESAIQQIVNAVQEDSDGEFPQTSSNSSPNHHDDSGFQSPANENVEEGEPQPITVDTEQLMLTMVEGVKMPVC